MLWDWQERKSWDWGGLGHGQKCSQKMGSWLQEPCVTVGAA